jgi:hypothetical protein
MLPGTYSSRSCAGARKVGTSLWSGTAIRCRGR